MDELKTESKAEMKAAVVTKFGVKSPVIMDWPRPEVGELDILIQVKSASINPIDWKIMQGATKLLLPQRPPFIIGNDGAGIVVETGSGVRKFRVGDEVFFRPKKDRVGTLAEYCIVRENEVALRPRSISWNESAGLPLVALTSWQALVDKARIEAGQKVLIHAGTGGVGTIAIQLAKSFGAYVATTCGPTGVDLVRRMGADEVINYQEQKFDQILKDYDIVLDTMGGEILKSSFRILKPGGVVVTINGIPTPDVAEKYGKGFILKTIFTLANRKFHRLAKTSSGRYEYLMMDASSEQLTEIAKLVDSGKIKPVVDKVFPLNQVDQAFAYQMSGRAKGKVVVEIS